LPGHYIFMKQNTAPVDSKSTRGDRLRKALDTKKAKKEQFAAQTIRVDDDWQIVRADEINWEVQFKGKFRGFFGSLPNAFDSLPAKMLGEQAQGDVAAVLGSQKAIQETIRKALSIKLA
jgi:hypothetical protein